ncbi:MAG: NAD(P)-binding domain-containing protein [Flavobacteriales bacterium]
MKVCLVIGFGWLGNPLAKALRQHGHQLYATTTNPKKIKEMEEAEIHPLLLTKRKEVLHWEMIPTQHFDSIVITFPPFEGIEVSLQNLLSELSFDQLILTSSTGVYLDQSEIITEDSAVDSSHLVTRMEQIVKEMSPTSLYIFRLAGHIGPNRHPLNYFLRSSKMISNGNASVNLIHQADIIQALKDAIHGKIPKGIYNLCYPSHPSKINYYGTLAKEIANVTLQFDDQNIGKTIDGSKITLVSEFKYDSSIHEINDLYLKKDNN